MEVKRDISKTGIVGTEPTTRVWLNGTFDLLHYGHIHLFQHARNLYPNTIVRVGLDADERIRQMKGDTRPINPLDLRVKFLQSIRYIDEVVTFSSDSELRAEISVFKPHIMCIGDDYRNRTIIGEELIPRVEYVKRYNDLSSSEILSKLNMG